MEQDRLRTTPHWALNTTVYEVNVRQYTEFGTFAAFELHLERLWDMGIRTLWFMPITPIGIEGRKNSRNDLGSYYAVRDYYAVNEEFGTMEDWKALVNKCHSIGFKVIIDWVANHTAPDHPWILEHPDYYVHNSEGFIIPPNVDWTDTRQLNYENPKMRAAMIDAMRFWITETDIDGFRCDMAKLITPEFWHQAITQLRKTKKVLMIAEAEDPGYYEAGFDAQYTWTIFHAMKSLYDWTIGTPQFIEAVEGNFQYLGDHGLRLTFTTNHDENTWTGSEYSLFPEAVRCFAVYTFAMQHALPMVYSGQEAGNTRQLQFFNRDPIEWDYFSMQYFYKHLVTLRNNNPAMASDAEYEVLKSSNACVHCICRRKGKSKVLIVLNLSPFAQRCTVTNDLIIGEAQELFSAATISLDTEHWFSLTPWNYFIFEYSK